MDEANAAIGVARLHVAVWRADLDAELAIIQNDLFDLGAGLATPDADMAADWRLTPARAQWLEGRIDAMNAHLQPLRSFVLPAGAPAAAHLHFARTVVRRAERALVALASMPDEWVNPAALAFLNRLSDYLFVMARLANAGAGGDVLWQPAASRAKEDGRGGGA